MINFKEIQTCYKCKEEKHHSEFYDKGNRFMSCSDCRSQRIHRRESIKTLLEREQKIKKYGAL